MVTMNDVQSAHAIYVADDDAAEAFALGWAEGLLAESVEPRPTIWMKLRESAADMIEVVACIGWRAAVDLATAIRGNESGGH